MIDPEKMLGSLVRGAMGGDLAGAGRGRRRRGRRRGRRSPMIGRAGKGALALGALGVAMAAFEHFSQKQNTATPAAAAPGPPLPPVPETKPSTTSTQEPPPPPPLPPLPTSDAAASPPPGGEALLLVRAMIAAANADHRLDDEERGRILTALDEAEATREDKAELLAELENPLGLAALAEQAATPELARQVYLASCLAIEIDTQAERDYLDRLAHRLGLDAARAAELEEMLQPGADADTDADD